MTRFIASVRLGEPVGSTWLTAWPSTRPAQRATCDRRELQLVCEARLDSRVALARTLNIDCATSDAELLLEAYDRWGLESARQLEGDFAFVVYDQRRCRVFAARDRLGVRPCFYCAKGGTLTLSSNAALLADYLASDYDERQIAQFLAGQNDEPNNSFFVGIRRLRAGAILLADARGVTSRPYWRLNTEVSTLSVQALGDNLRECFIRAVCDRVPAKQPYGCMLSGGIDSSAITGVAASHAHNRRLRAFTFVHPAAPTADERRYVRAFLGSYPGIGWSVVSGEGCGVVPRAAPLSQPSHAPNLGAHLAIYEASRQHDIGVVLDGFDGDSVVSHGVRRLLELLTNGALFELRREVAAYSRSRGISVWRALRLLILRPLVPTPVRAALARKDLSLLTPRLRPLVSWRSLRPARTEAAYHAQRLTSTLTSRGLELLDEAAAHRGVEPRYPFFERRLVELCVSVPAAFKLRQGNSRWIFRESLAPELTLPVLVRRDKVNHTPVFQALLWQHQHELNRWLERMPPALAPYVSTVGFRAALRRAKQGDLGRSLSLFRSLSLARWLDTREQHANHIKSRAATSATPAA